MQSLAKVRNPPSFTRFSHTITAYMAAPRACPLQTRVNTYPRDLLLPVTGYRVKSSRPCSAFAVCLSILDRSQQRWYLRVKFLKSFNLVCALLIMMGLTWFWFGYVYISLPLPPGLPLPLLHKAFIDKCTDGTPPALSSSIRFMYEDRTSGCPATMVLHLLPVSTRYSSI
jgi:hypothetical protein